MAREHGEVRDRELEGFERGGLVRVDCGFGDDGGGGRRHCCN